MNPHEIVVHEVDRERVMWFSSFLLNAFVKRVNRRIPIRIERF